ncbi:MAG: sigma-70 family RNA polymerase sigma factor [Clostridia bacterium]|nr:sigma-70 family RNA polymerase sigma factor [Clostridia bacterium]MBP3706498.1 sigma-70 family RNA polymerase sigma factor [Clostridia bacterium]
MAEVKNRNSLVEDNLRLVHSLCRRFTDRGIEYDDLYQAGCVGLIKAADAFDEKRGYCFSTYAVPVILGEVRRLFRDGGAVKVSRSVKELGLRISREKALMELKLGRDATVSELAKALGVSNEEITDAVCALQPVVSLTYESEDGSVEIDIPESGPEEILSNKLLLETAFDVLEEDERMIISYRFYHNLTQSKTADILGMSQVQVSRKERKILQKLRKAIEK